MYAVVILIYTATFLGLAIALELAMEYPSRQRICEWVAFLCLISSLILDVLILTYGAYWYVTQ